jgi:hypothetical protein
VHVICQSLQYHVFSQSEGENHGELTDQKEHFFSEKF